MWATQLLIFLTYNYSNKKKESWSIHIGFFYEWLVGKHLNLKQLYLLMINIQISLERNMINNWLTLSTTFYTMYFL